VPLSPPTPGLPGTPAIPGTPGTQAGPTTADPAPDTGGGPIKRIGDTTGERGGAMAMVGAGGLLLLLAVAEADRRKMRSAQRAIPMEV
jgi:hypothetical protein